MTFDDLLACFGELMDKVSLISDVGVQEQGPGHASMKVFTKDPANLGALELQVLLNDHATHAHINSHNLARVQGDTGVLYRFPHNGVLMRVGEVLHDLSDVNRLTGLKMVRNIH